MRILAAALVLAACGHDAAKPDGGGGGDDDADIDADPNVRGTVTVNVVDKLGGPLPGLHAVFIDTDATVTDVLTDATGIATASVFPNASVTVEWARSSNTSFGLTTLLALNPGDDVTLIATPAPASLAENAFFQRVIPMPTADVMGASKSGSIATYTTLEPHGLAAGDTVVVSSSSVAGYNGTWTVATAPTTTTFTASLGGGGLGASTGGIAAKAYPFTVSYPAYTGAQSYLVYTPCGPLSGGASLAPQLSLLAACAGTTMDLVVVARGAGNAPLAYAGKTGVAVSAGGSTTITDTWHALDAFGASYSNPTTRVTDIELERFVPYARGTAAATGSATTAGGAASINVTSPSSPTAIMRTTLQCPPGSSADCVSTPTGTAQQTITEKVDGTAASYSLDIDANLLPWVSLTYDAATTTLKVTPTGTGTIDLFEANMQFTGATTSARNGMIFQWRVFGPTIGDVTFPTLPSSLPGDPTVRTTDVRSSSHAYVCETTAVAGYRNAIKNVYETLGECEISANPTTKPLGAVKGRLSQYDY